MKKTIVFDVDDTLCDSAWARLNNAAGVTAKKDYELYQKFSRGEFDYESWTQQLVDIYRQNNILTESLAREVLTSYTLKEDAEDVIATLKQRGYEVILITGGFDTTVEHLGAFLQLDTFYATSKLVFDTAGKFLDLSVAKDDGVTKVELLKKYLQETGKSSTNCIPVGDSSNDIPLFDFTKNGITFDWSKEQVQAAARHRISTLTDLLEIL